MQACGGACEGGREHLYDAARDGEAGVGRWWGRCGAYCGRFGCGRDMSNKYSPAECDPADDAADANGETRDTPDGYGRVA